MKFDPNTWTLQVGRKWRHCTIAELILTEGVDTRLDSQTCSLLGLIPSRANSSGNYYSDMESIDEPALIGSFSDSGRGLRVAGTPSDQPIIEGTEAAEYRTSLTREIFSQMSQSDREWLIYQSIQQLNTKLETIIMNQADFDAKLASLKPAIDQVKTDFEAFKAAAAAKGVDLSTESATLDTSLTALGDLHTEVSTPAA